MVLPGPGACDLKSILDSDAGLPGKAMADSFIGDVRQRLSVNAYSAPGSLRVGQSTYMRFEGCRQPNRQALHSGAGAFISKCPPMNAMPTAVVEAINARARSFVARCDDGSYAYFELMAPLEIRVGDVVKWEPNNCGTVLRNISTGAEAIHVNGPHHQSSRMMAMAYLGSPPAP